MSRELVGFWRFFIDVESCKCVLSWWWKEEHKFPTIVLVTWHIISIPTNQIEWKNIISIVGIFDNTLYMPFTNIKFGQVDFCENNWPSDWWIGWLKPTNFLYAYDVELNLIAKLEAKFQYENHKNFLGLNEPFNLIFSLCMWLVTNGFICALLKGCKWWIEPSIRV